MKFKKYGFILFLCVIINACSNKKDERENLVVNQLQKYSNENLKETLQHIVKLQVSVYERGRKPIEMEMLDSVKSYHKNVLNLMNKMSKSYVKVSDVFVDLSNYTSKLDKFFKYDNNKIKVEAIFHSKMIDELSSYEIAHIKNRITNILNKAVVKTLAYVGAPYCGLSPYYMYSAQKTIEDKGIQNSIAAVQCYPKVNYKGKFVLKEGRVEAIDTLNTFCIVRYSTKDSLSMLEYNYIHPIDYSPNSYKIRYNYER